MEQRNRNTRCARKRPPIRRRRRRSIYKPDYARVRQIALTKRIIGVLLALLLAAAAAAGADVFVTGECKHHQALEAQARGMAVLTCGHYETERVVLETLIARLQGPENDVQYLVAHAETSPQRRF